MNNQGEVFEEQQKTGPKLSVFSFFAILAAIGLFLAFFLPMLTMQTAKDEFTAYKKEFDLKYANLQAKLEQMKNSSDAVSVDAFEESTVEFSEFSEFFDNYGFFFTKNDKVKVKDIRKFKDIIDSLFSVFDKGSLKSVYDFSKILEKNKHLISNVENADNFVRNISVMAKTLKWLSMGIPIMAGLLVLFIILSGFGKFNAIFLILTFIPGIVFAAFGAVSLFLLPNLSEVFTSLQIQNHVVIPEQILNFVSGLVAGPGMLLMFISGCLMFVISIFGVSKRNFTIVYTFYLFCAIALAILVLNATNVI